MWAATAIVATTAFSTHMNRQGQKKARRQATRDQERARRAEVFAETEGEGVGNIGAVQLEIDDDITEQERLRRKGITSRL